MRSVQIVGSDQAQRARHDPACLAVVVATGTAAGLSSADLAITHLPSCIPSLHGHYPASTLLWMLCPLPGCPSRSLSRRTGITDSCIGPSRRSVSTHQVRPVIAFARSREFTVTGFRSFPGGGRTVLGLRHYLAGSPLTPSRIEFVIILRTDSSPPVAPHPTLR